MEDLQFKSLVYSVYVEDYQSSDLQKYVTLHFPLFSIRKVKHFAKNLSKRKSFKKSFYNVHIFVDGFVLDVKNPIRSLYSCIYIDGDEFGYDGDIKQVKSIENQILDI